MSLISLLTLNVSAGWLDKVFAPAQVKELVSIQGRFAVKPPMELKETVTSVVEVHPKI